MSTGGALRLTAQTRPLVSVTITDTRSGYPANDLYVRRFWTAVLGPSAVAELLRIAEAGRSGVRIRRPVHLHTLMETGLVQVANGEIIVGNLIPPVPGGLIKRLTPSLRIAHESWAPPVVARKLFAQGSPARQAKGYQLANRKTHRDPEVGSSAHEEHGDQPCEEATYPGACQLTRGPAGDQGLSHQLSYGPGDDTGGGEGGHRGDRTELGAEQESDDGRSDEEPHDSGQADEDQTEPDQLQQALTETGFLIHPNQERQKPALQVVDESQRGPVEQERSENDAA